MRTAFLFLLLLTFLMGCAAPFQIAKVDPVTGNFPTDVEVERKFIKIFHPLAGIKEVHFVYLRAHSPFVKDRFYEFMKDSLIRIGFNKIYGEKELSRIVIESGLSKYVTSLSDLISLHNLAKVTGPFLIIESNIFRLTDVVYRFDLQIIEPIKGETCLEISRIRTNWVDMDTEINYPILNVIKRWYEESAKIPHEKPSIKPNESDTKL